MSAASHLAGSLTLTSAHVMIMMIIMSMVMPDEESNWSGSHRIDSHATHDIHRDVVHVAAIHQQVSLVVDGGDHAHNGHAGPHQPPQRALLMHTALPFAQVGAVAEVTA